MGYIVDVPPTIDTVQVQARMYQGRVHGNDATGAVDVEFADAYHAVVFAKSVGNALGWKVSLRDSITDFRHSVTVTVQKDYTPQEL